MEKLKKPLIFVSLIIGILIVNRELNLTAYFSDVEKMKSLLDNNFKWALLVYILCTVFACTVLALPGITFAVIAGLIFGPWWGTFACLIATTLGASLAFLVGRYFLKDSLKPMLEKNKMLKKLLFTEGQNDLILLMITRLVPIFPYNIQNFAYGITDIGFWKYTLLTFVFMIPGVGIYTIGSAGILAEGNKWTYFAVAGILLAIVSLVGMIIKNKYIGKKRCIILFTRVPSEHMGKTRLKTHLVGKEREILQQNFIKDTYETSKSLDEDIVIAYGDEGDINQLKSIISQPEPSYISQKGDNIGEKMANVFKEVFDRGYDQAVLIGSDIPHMEKTDLNKAFISLKEADVTINPTIDGGYYLIGLNKLNKNKDKIKVEDIFDIENYGTLDVFSSTIDKLVLMKLTIITGKKNFDIDTWEDMKSLKKHLEINNNLCNNTREYVKLLLDKGENENINYNTNI